MNTVTFTLLSCQTFDDLFSLESVYAVFVSQLTRRQHPFIYRHNLLLSSSKSGVIPLKRPIQLLTVYRQIAF